MVDLVVPYMIPYTCQFASPDLVRAFVHGEREVVADPCWAEYGASDAAEYAHWALRSCGVVCIKMAVEGITGSEPEPVMAWVRAGLAIDGYLTELRPDRPDRPVEKGWKHTSLAQLARDRGCSADLVQGLTLEKIAAHLQFGQVIVASVTAELGEDGLLTRNSGHLVVIYGVALGGDGQVQEMILHNPSRRTPTSQVGARIPVERFMQGFSGRGILIGRS